MGGEGIEEIKDFIDKVKTEFHPDIILLFGSRARGDHLKDSDYDLIIVSPKFRKVHFLERIYQVLEFWDYEWDVDILPYTPEEFQKKKNQIGIVNQAVREGLMLEI
jgi:uncharacterized protein